MMPRQQLKENRTPGSPGRPRKEWTMSAEEDPHGFLVKLLLPKALRKLDRVLNVNIAQDHKSFLRAQAVQLRACNLIVQACIHLQDQALRRQAGGQISKLIEAVKAASSGRLTAEEEAALNAVTFIPPSARPEA